MIKQVLRSWRSLGLGVLAVAASACAAKIEGTIPVPAHNSASGSFKAGAGSSDLTPMPGIPMAGYSMGGKVARGVWVRLMARALYLEDSNGDAIVLVACDLDMIPNGLADRVAEMLLTGGVVGHLGRQQILLSASHTHHGPGSYFTSQMYNSFTTPRGGFDREVFDFLARRIVDAIEDAYTGRTEAILRTAPAPGSVGAPNDRLPCVFRNRSLPAFGRNPDTLVNAIRSANPLSLPCPDRCPDPVACASVHTQIDYFTVVKASDPTQVIGMGIFLASHATVLSPDNELYSPDFFGVVSNLLESGAAGCLGGSPKPVVAVFNGAEGDVSPAWTADGRDRREVLAIAHDIAAKVCAILPAAKDRPDPDIAFEWKSLKPLTNQPVVDEFSRRPTWEHRTAENPRVGLPALGGAEDGRTILYDMGFVEGVRGPMRNDQGAKQPFELDIAGLRASVSSIAAVTAPPPDAAPIGVYRLGNLALVTLPGEFTTLLGARIRISIAAQLSASPPDRVVLIGLSGGHVSYVTTAEEYEAQNYEGAQNIYGAATGPLLTNELATLATTLGSAPLKTTIPFDYDAGGQVRWRARDTGGPPYEVIDGLEDVVQDPVTGKPNPSFPTYCFHDAVPRLSQINPGACQRPIPEVHVETAIAGTEVANSFGLDMVTVLTGVGTITSTSTDATEWCAIWLVPPATPTDQYRFRVEPIAGPTLMSPTFLAGGASPPVFFAAANAPLEQDRRHSICCHPSLEFLGCCGQPLTCVAP